MIEAIAILENPMDILSLLPQSLVTGLIISAALGAVAVPLLARLSKISKEYQEVKALVVASLQEAAEASKAGRPISPDAVRNRVLKILGEASDVVQALKG